MLTPVQAIQVPSQALAPRQQWWQLWAEGAHHLPEEEGGQGKEEGCCCSSTCCCIRHHSEQQRRRSSSDLWVTQSLLSKTWSSSTRSSAGIPDGCLGYGRMQCTPVGACLCRCLTASCDLRCAAGHCQWVQPISTPGGINTAWCQCLLMCACVLALGVLRPTRVSIILLPRLCMSATCEQLITTPWHEVGCVGCVQGAQHVPAAPRPDWHLPQLALFCCAAADTASHSHCRTNGTITAWVSKAACPCWNGIRSGCVRVAHT